MTALTGLRSPTVRLVTGHLVSDSMVTRSYFKDSWSGAVMTDDADRLWLVSVTDALAPDVKFMLRRGEDAGGPPASTSKLTLSKVTMSWPGASGRFVDGGQVDILNPRVLAAPNSIGVAIISLDRVSGLAEGIEAGAGPVPYPMRAMTAPSSCQEGSLSPLDGLNVASIHESDDGGLWPITRSGALASDPVGGFAGVEGAIALDVGLGAGETGAPAYWTEGPTPILAGLVRRLSQNLTMLLPERLIAEALARAVGES